MKQLSKGLIIYVSNIYYYICGLCRNTCNWKYIITTIIELNILLIVPVP